MSATNTCLVCFEACESNQRLALAPITTGNGDSLRSQDCGHPICRTCMGSHVKARVEMMQTSLRCPAVDCTVRLFEHDLRALRESEHLANEVVDRYIELSTQEYTSRAEGMLPLLEMTDIETLQTMWSLMRLCPRCHVVLTKSHGCNSFYCVCGHHFDYASAPRAVGNDIPHFGHMLKLAHDLKVPLRTAMRYGSWDVFFKSGRTSKALGISVEEACDLHHKAVKGDEAARAEIRRARELQRASEEAERAAEEAKEKAASSLKCAGIDGEESEADTADSDPGLFLSEESVVCDLTW